MSAKIKLTLEDENMKDLIKRLEIKYPNDLLKQFHIVRTYTPGPTFGKFCDFKNMTRSKKDAFRELVIINN